MPGNIANIDDIYKRLVQEVALSSVNSKEFDIAKYLDSGGIIGSDFSDETNKTYKASFFSLLYYNIDSQDKLKELEDEYRKRGMTLDTTGIDINDFTVVKDFYKKDLVATYVSTDVELAGDLDSIDTGGTTHPDESVDGSLGRFRSDSDISDLTVDVDDRNKYLLVPKSVNDETSEIVIAHNTLAHRQMLIRAVASDYSDEIQSMLDDSKMALDNEQEYLNKLEKRTNDIASALGNPSDITENKVNTIYENLYPNDKELYNRIQGEINTMNAEIDAYKKENNLSGDEVDLTSKILNLENEISELSNKKKELEASQPNTVINMLMGTTFAQSCALINKCRLAGYQINSEDPAAMNIITDGRQLGYDLIYEVDTKYKYLVHNLDYDDDKKQLALKGELDLDSIKYQILRLSCLVANKQDTVIDRANSGELNEILTAIAKFGEKYNTIDALPEKIISFFNLEEKRQEPLSNLPGYIATFRKTMQTKAREIYDETLNDLSEKIQDKKEVLATQIVAYKQIQNNPNVQGCTDLVNMRATKTTASFILE